MKPIWSTLLGERNYCYVCRVGVNYDAERIEKLIKIADVTCNFHEIKKDVQLCIDFDVINFGCITTEKVRKQD